MQKRIGVTDFLSQYNTEVVANAMKLREVILMNLPEINEQVDISAKMIAYCYGQRYTDLICTIIPSKTGLKLGFNRGNELDTRMVCSKEQAKYLATWSLTLKHASDRVHSRNS